MTDVANAIVLLLNFVIVPGVAYGSQLALGALGVTLIFGILRFANFAHGDVMAFGTMVVLLTTWWFQGMDVGIAPLPTALIACPSGSWARPPSTWRRTASSSASTGGARARP